MERMLIGDINKIIEILDDFKVIPVSNEKNFSIYQDIALTPEINNKIYIETYNMVKSLFEKMNPSKEISCKDIEKELLRLIFSPNFNLMNRKYGRPVNKIMYHYIKYVFLSKKISGDITRLIFLLREIHFPEEWIQNILFLHFQINYFNTFFDIFSFLLENYDSKANEDSHKILKEKLTEKVKSSVLKRSELFFSFDENSSVIQPQIIKMIDLGDENVENLIMSSNWVGLNRYYSSKVKDYKLQMLSSVKEIEDKKNYYKGLFKKGDLDKIIDLLCTEDAIKQKALMVSFRWSVLSNDFNSGLLTFEQKNVLRNIIAQEISALIDEI